MGGRRREMGDERWEIMGTEDRDQRADTQAIMAEKE
jgi:hypothetical protein